MFSVVCNWAIFVATRWSVRLQFATAFYSVVLTSACPLPLYQIFVPIRDGDHYFVYCFNFIHTQIDVLDLNDYFMKCSDQEERHQAVFAKIPIIDAAFQKVSNLKLPRVSRWRQPFINVPKQARPSDCVFFVWKYMEYYDGDSMTKEINPVSHAVKLICLFFAVLFFWLCVHHI